MPMPYHLTKGPWISILESAANDQNRRPQLLADLRNPNVRLVDIAVTNQQDAANFDAFGPLAQRLNSNWFGFDAAGNPQAPFDAANPERTGYWVDYHGNTERILRTALLRSLEVAMGLDHGASAGESDRTWPIEVFWTCPRGWFECWVTWRQHDPAQTDGGQVTLLICTPADTVNVVRPRFVEPLNPENGEQHVNPTSPDRRQGMWLVAHSDHRSHLVQWIDPSTTPPAAITTRAVVDALNSIYSTDVKVGYDDAIAPDPWPIPSPSTLWEGIGDVVVVSPPEIDGGVRSTGRPYAPAP